VKRAFGNAKIVRLLTTENISYEEAHTVLKKIAKMKTKPDEITLSDVVVLYFGPVADYIYKHFSQDLNESTVDVEVYYCNGTTREPKRVPTPEPMTMDDKMNKIKTNPEPPNRNETMNNYVPIVRHQYDIDDAISTLTHVTHPQSL
jgi:hypothetical protein